jgi:hypothetical protein
MMGTETIGPRTARTFKKGRLVNHNSTYGKTSLKVSLLKELINFEEHHPKN